MKEPREQLPPPEMPNAPIALPTPPDQRRKPSDSEQPTDQPLDPELPPEPSHDINP